MFINALCTIFGVGTRNDGRVGCLNHPSPTRFAIDEVFAATGSGLPEPPQCSI